MSGKVEKISEAEAEIMRAVWGHQGPVTYTYLRTLLTEQKGWESPTVNTLVNRLVKKGILNQEKKEVYYYTATLSEKEYTLEKTKAFIQKVYGGSAKGLVSALFTNHDITQEDFNELREQWSREEKEDE
ncbi:MAG: BlaI/MecI/CopY family transcriptional regulator [Oscillospiraceae bacterium]|nr:BlaI/MecI/CopY family transcriptional regulator [Oscillospiraceae bacterium]